MRDPARDPLWILLRIPLRISFSGMTLVVLESDADKIVEVPCFERLTCRPLDPGTTTQGDVR